MQRFTKGDSALWDRLDAEQSDSEFLKTAEFDVEETEISSGPRIPAGYLMKVAGVEVRDPEPPAPDAPEWVKKAYQEDLRNATLKMAGFMGEALENLGKSIAGIFRGSAKVHPEIKAKDFLKSVEVLGGKASAKGNAVVSLKKLQRALEKIPPGDPLDKSYRIGQLAVAIGVPVMGASGAYHLWSKDKLRRQHAAVEKHLLDQPEFENLADKEQVVGEGFGLMRKYAPTIAADPIVAKSFVTMLSRHGDQQNIEIIQNLMEAEKKYRDKGEFARDWKDISRLVRHPVLAPFVGAKGG